MKKKRRTGYFFVIFLVTLAIVFAITDIETLSMEITDILDSESQKVPVLLYHHILKEEENTKFVGNDSVISYKQFYDQMKYINDNGYTTITSKQLFDYIHNEIPIPEKSVVITFDDGYLSNEHYAYHIMKEFNQRGDIFLLTSQIQEHPLEFNPEFLPMLDWGRIEEMHDVFTFYSHTHNLHKFINKKPALKVLSAEEIVADLTKSLSYNNIEKLAFAYPYGAYNNTCIETLKENDIKMAYTVKKGYVTRNSDPYKLRRFVISPTTTMDQFKGIFDISTN